MAVPLHHRFGWLTPVMGAWLAEKRGIRPDSALRLATLAGIVLTPTAGKGMLVVKKRKQQVRKTHRWLGRFTLLAMLARL